MNMTNKVKHSLSFATWIVIVFITGTFLYLSLTVTGLIQGVRYGSTDYSTHERAYLVEARHIEKVFDSDMSVSKIRHVLIYIDGLCEYYNVDYNMVKNIISAESSWKEHAHSYTNDRGLMQISDGVAEDHGTPHGSCSDPYTSLTVGVKHLAKIKESVGDYPAKIIYAYHHGVYASQQVTLAQATINKYVRRVMDMKWSL
jgi:hypothetical protein